MEKNKFEDLKNPEIFEKITQEIKECERFGFVREDGHTAFQIFSSIKKNLENNPEFKNENPELYQKYYDLKIYLEFHIINFLYDDNDIVELYEKHFKDALSKNIDFEGWLSLKANSIQLPFRDNFLAKILSAIKKNQQKIGSKNIIISSKEVEPTIQNWIKDYEYTSEPGIHSLVERNGYFIHSKNTRNLNEEEKKQVKILLQFYDKLHLKVTDVGGLGSYPIEMYNINLKKPVAIENYTTKEQQRVGKSVQETAGTVRPIPFPTKKSEQREKLLAENKKLAEREMRGAVDIKKLEAQEPGNKFIASLKRIGKPRKKLEEVKIEKTKVIKAVPEKEVIKEIGKTKAEELPNPPKKVFHKEHKVLTQAKPIIVSKQINRIQNLTILEFRDLGPDAKQSAQKLLNNLRDIAKTHEERKIAQENFMKSPLYKLYEAMEKQSSLEKKSITQVAEDRKQQKMEYLSEDEYIAVKSISKLI